MSTEDREATFEYRPPGVSTAVAIGASLVVVVALAPASLGASGVAGLGAAVLASALLRGSRRVVTLGASVVFVSLLAAGAAEGPVIPVVVGGIATLLAYDAGHYAVRLGQQVGRHGTTTSAEVAHLGTTAAVSVAAATAGLLLFTAGPVGQPTAVLVGLLLAALLFVSALSLRGHSIASG